MENSVYDVIVIGAGIAGSSAANSLTKRGLKVLLIEQFSLLHSNGSSHGNTRIFRTTYTVPLYSQLAKASLPLWLSAEQESKMKIYHKTGGLDFGDKNDKTLLGTIEVCRKYGFKHEVLNSEEMKKRFPQLKNIKENWIGCFQEDGGYLNAMEACRMFQWLALLGGCKIHQNEKFLSFDSLKGQVVTEKGKYQCKKLVVCCGAWTPKILKQTNVNLNLETWRCSYAFWKIKNPQLFEKFPIFINFNEDGNIYYGFPPFEYKDKMKASIHYSKDIIDPDENSKTPSEEIIKKTKEFMLKHFNSMVDEPYEKIEKTTCLYSVSEDENFILDYHPKDKNIIFFGGESGHGFKFGPMLGEIISDLVQEKKPKYDISILGFKRLLEGNLQKGPSMLRIINDDHSSEKIKSKL